MPRRLDRRRLLKLLGAGAAVAGGGGVVAALRRGGDGGSEPVAANRAPTTNPTTSTSTTMPAPTTAEPAPEPTAAPETPPSTELAEESGEGAAAATAGALICRDAWGARPPAGSLPPHTVSMLTVHHTAVHLDDNRDAPGRLRSHQRYHQDNGFSDLAYHVVVDAHGHPYEGRAFDQPGETFTDYDPTGHFLATCEGHFDQQEVTDAQLDGLARVLAWASARYGVPPEAIRGHRDHASTTCPGDALYRRITDGTLAARVRAILAADPSLPTTCGPPAESLVADIEAGRA